jgi:enoyl-CoA hydratase
MRFDNILVERAGAVAFVTINRPAVLNALNAATLEELGLAFDDLRRNADIRVVVLTGAGEKAFVAGADIRELSEQGPASARDYAVRGQQLFTSLETLGKPVIAAINGYALGGGCELAMACSIRIAAETARLGQPEIDLGLLPGFGGTQRLPRIVGRGRALELMLTGAPVSAPEAWRIGLVNRVVPPADLLKETRALAETLAAKAPLAVQYVLQAVEYGLDTTLAVGCAYEASLFGLAAATDDMREGTRAFLEKRTPVFQGR